MLKVLVHQEGSTCCTFSLFIILCSFFLGICSAQTTVGLSVVDSPAPQSVEHAGSTLPIAIDVSNQGTLSASGTSNLIAGSQISSIGVYLVSAASNVNITLSAGSSLLQQEPGSTVKHLNYALPDCLSPGNYNLEFHELAQVNGQANSAFNTVPITIQKANFNDATVCSNLGTNSTPSVTEPASTVTVTISTSISLPTGTGIITVTIDPSGFPLHPSGKATTLTITESTATSGGTASQTGVPSSTVSPTGNLTSSASPTGNSTRSASATGVNSTDAPTVTVTTTATPKPTTVTAVMVSQSIQTITATPSGFSTTYTSLTATTATVTAVVGNNGFLPVNGGAGLGVPYSSAIYWLILISAWTLFV